MGDVRPEYIFLGYLAEGPSHGYNIYRHFREDLEGLWHISESQMYASLKRLEKRGWISLDTTGGAGAEGGAAERASKRDVQANARQTIGRQSCQRFALTARGLAAYEAWLNTPTSASPRLLKLEFLSRLYFALRRDMELAYTLIEAQRLSLEIELERLQQPAEKPPSASSQRSEPQASVFRRRLTAQGPAPTSEPETTSELSLETCLNRPLLFPISILAKDFRIHQIRAALEWLRGVL